MKSLFLLTYLLLPLETILGDVLLEKVGCPEEFQWNSLNSTSPRFNWSAKIENHSDDSLTVYINPICDTSNKIKVATFLPFENSVIPQVKFLLTPPPWSSDEKYLLIAATNTNKNDTLSKQEIFKADVSTITSVSSGSSSTPKKVAGKEIALIKISNFPNPFNPITTIEYSIPEDNFVSINIYNTDGQLIKVLHEDKATAGSHTLQWNGTNNLGESVGSGQYYYQVVSGDYIDTKKMVLLK